MNPMLSDLVGGVQTVALIEAEQGIVVELAPRRAAVRRLQHRMVAQSVGSAPQRHQTIYPVQ